jgi:hypothetical protein
MNTTELLLTVADKIEFEPERFSMSSWNSRNFIDSPLELAGQEPECGTTCCVAGWAVALTPREEVPNAGWSYTGAQLLGLNYELASLLFMETTKEAPEMAACLRRLAKVPEERRVCGDPGVDEALAEIDCVATKNYNHDGSLYWELGIL